MDFSGVVIGAGALLENLRTWSNEKNYYQTAWIWGRFCWGFQNPNQVYYTIGIYLFLSNAMRNPYYYILPSLKLTARTWTSPPGSLEIPDFQKPIIFMVSKMRFLGRVDNQLPGWFNSPVGGSPRSPSIHLTKVVTNSLAELLPGFRIFFRRKMIKVT